MRPGIKVEAQVIFVTGTDTGVGKTLLTGLLVHHLRLAGCHALAMKPFCSGSREDVELLGALQDSELSEREINPFYFRHALAPLVAARANRRSILMEDVLERITAVTLRLLEGQTSNSKKYLLIEGAGGLLVPLGEKEMERRGSKRQGAMAGSAIYTLRDVITRLDGAVILVAPNRLGTINHTMLTVVELQRVGVKKLVIALMNGKEPDNSARTNPKMLAELVTPIRVIPVPFFEKDPLKIGTLKKNAKKIKKTLARILA